MKQTINGKRYNTDTCEVLCEKNHYNYSNNYCGFTKLLRAKDGMLLIFSSGNGQDCYFPGDDLLDFENSQYTIDDFEMTDDQEARCVELKLIEIV